MKAPKLYISYFNVKGYKLIPDKKHFLKTNDVIIYAIYLPNFIHLKSDLAAFLNPKELYKSERFHKELDRNRFIIYRSVFKFILAAHTQLEVKNIYLDYHFNKKPYLASHPSLYFNISHSENFAVIAVSLNKIGIDIEFIPEDFDFTHLLPDIFTGDEILTIQNAADKKHAFYTSWTRKEAFVKALGKGIDDDFKYIPCLDGQHTIDTDLLKNTQNWQLYSFNLADHYLGAVAFEGLPVMAKNLELFMMPNTMKDLQEMVQIRNH